MPTVNLYPNGDTTIPLQLPVCGIFPAAPPTHYDKVQTNDGDTTYVENDQNFVTEEDVYTIQTSGIPAGSTINSVKIDSVCARENIGGVFANSMHNIIYTESTRMDYPHTIAPGYHDYSDLLVLNPVTGLAWTLTEVNTLIIGLQLHSTVVGIRDTWGRCTQVYVTVDYTPLVTTKLRRLLVGEG